MVPDELSSQTADDLEGLIQAYDNRAGSPTEEELLQHFCWDRHRRRPPAGDFQYEATELEHERLLGMVDNPMCTQVEIFERFIYLCRFYLWYAELPGVIELIHQFTRRVCNVVRRNADQ